MTLLSRKAVLLAKEEGGVVTIRTGVNDAIDFSEDGGAELNATLSSGNYTPSELATEIQTQMRAVGDNNLTCTYDESTHKITIANSALTTSLELLWTGTNSATTAGAYIGFDTAADDTGAKTYTADNVIGYGQDPTPTAAANAFEAISDLAINPVGNLNNRLPYSNSLSPAQPLLGQRWYEISFVVELKGSGTAATAPTGIGDLLKACGLSEAITTTVTYAPDSTKDDIKSVTIWAYLDGLLHKFNGCRGNVRLLCVVGETAKLEFNFLGKYAAPTDVAIASPTYDSTVPPVVLDATFTFDSDTTLKIQQLEIDLGTTLANRDDMNDAAGIAGFEIIGREGAGSINPEAELIAGYDFWSIWTDSAQKELSITIGSASGNKYVITCPKIVEETIGYGDRNGIRIFDIPFKLSKNSGEDEISIVHST